MAYDKLKHHLRTISPATYCRVFSEDAAIRHLLPIFPESRKYHLTRVFYDQLLMTLEQYIEIRQNPRDVAKHLSKGGLDKLSFAQMLRKHYLSEDLPTGENRVFLIVPNADQLLVDSESQYLIGRLLDRLSDDDRISMCVIFFGLSELPTLTPRLQDRLETIDERDSQEDDRRAYIERTKESMFAHNPDQLLNAITPYLSGMSKHQIDRTLADFVILRKGLADKTASPEQNFMVAKASLNERRSRYGLPEVENLKIE